MGQAIQYCARCAIQVREADFEKRKAYRIEDWVCCASCAPDALKSLPLDRAQALDRLLSGQGKPSPPVRAASRETRPTPAVLSSASSAARIAAASATPPGVPISWWLGGAGLLLAGLLLLVWVMSRGTPPVQESPLKISPRMAPLPVAVPSAKETAAQEAFRKARQVALDHPDDLEAQMRAYGDLALLEDSGEAGKEARKVLEALRAREREAAERAARGLDTEIDALTAREDYAGAVRLVQSAKARMAGAPWASAVAERERKLGDRISREAQALKAKATEAKAKGRRAELDTLVGQARRWGIGWVIEDLEAAVAAVPDPPPPPPPPPPERSAEGKDYLVRWEAAMARASARDYAGAAEELARAGDAWKEAATREESAQDLRDLRDLDRVYRMAVAGLRSSHTLSLRTVGGQRISGRVLSVDADRVELLEDIRKPTVFTEWREVDATSLGPRLREAGADPRVGAIFYLLEGDPAGALDLLAGDASKLSPKYFAYAESARAKALKPSAEELRAREIYEGAERDFRQMGSRDKAIEAYTLLKQKYKDTALVRHAQEKIDRRAGSGKEYTFLGYDFGFSGTFAVTKEGRAESLAEPDPAQPGHSWVEWEFWALPSVNYRAWVLVGGCCAEVMACHYQATGLNEVSPKTHKRVSAEPGGEVAVPVKLLAKNLKPTHSKNEPKKPTRWEWTELVLPRGGPPGLKKVRVYTEEQGFGIGAVVVSSTRTRAPSETEVEALVQTRALDALPSWAIDRPGNSPRVIIDDFEQGTKAWGYINGWEFPGATGSFTYDAAEGHEGKGSGRLAADFTGGGAYVGVWHDFPARAERNFKELRFWVKANGLKACGIRLADGTDQCHQREIALDSSADWQEVVLEFAKVVGAEHWGGANDGKWHGPLKGIGINIGKGKFTTASQTKGEIWIDDVQGVLDAEAH